MAWVNQHYEYNDLSALIAENHVELTLTWWDGDMMSSAHIPLDPAHKETARAYALILRRAAKRLEQMSEDLPEELP